MKKFIAALFITAFFSTPLFAQSVDPCTQTTQLTDGTTISISTQEQATGTISGTDYEYELWHNTGESQNTVSMKYYGADQGGGAAFRGDWKESDTKFDYLARIGYKFEKNGNGSGKLYTEYDDIYADYNYTRSGRLTGSNYSYIGIYGWARAGTDANLVEFYIVDDWWGNQYTEDTKPVTSSTTGGSIIDTATIDGATYQIIKNSRTNQPSIEGNKDFDQYFSVRQSPRKCGTISITEHFKAWEANGLKLGKLYEAKILAEVGAYNASTTEGWIDYTYASMRMASAPEGSFSLSTSTLPYNGGSISKSTSDLYHESGSSVTLTAVPAAGWQFDHWSGDASGTDATINITMDANKTVTANFVLEDGVNLVKNGDFSNTSDWTLNQWDNSSGSFTVANNEATITVSNLPTDGDIYNFQLIQNGIALIEGNKYILSFDAYAASARDIQVMLQMDGGDYTTYYSEDISLTNQKERFVFEFTMEKETDENGRLGFNLGNANPTVYISNVSLVYVAESAPGDSTGQTKTLNSPIKTDFKIRSISNGMLLVESNASSAIYLYNTSGKLVQKAQVSAGSNLVKLSVPNGIYVVKNVKTGQAQKILVK